MVHHHTINTIVKMECTEYDVTVNSINLKTVCMYCKYSLYHSRLYVCPRSQGRLEHHSVHIQLWKMNGCHVSGAINIDYTRTTVPHSGQRVGNYCEVERLAALPVSPWLTQFVTSHIHSLNAHTYPKRGGQVNE